MLANLIALYTNLAVPIGWYCVQVPLVKQLGFNTLADRENPEWVPCH